MSLFTCFMFLFSCGLSTLFIRIYGYGRPKWMLNFILKPCCRNLFKNADLFCHLGSSFNRMACLHTWQSWLKTGATNCSEFIGKDEWPSNSPDRQVAVPKPPTCPPFNLLDPPLPQNILLFRYSDTNTVCCLKGLAFLFIRQHKLWNDLLFNVIVQLRILNTCYLWNCIEIKELLIELSQNIEWSGFF